MLGYRQNGQKGFSMSRKEELEEKIFMLKMKDNWNDRDFQLYYELDRELLELEKEEEKGKF